MRPTSIVLCIGTQAAGTSEYMPAIRTDTTFISDIRTFGTLTEEGTVGKGTEVNPGTKVALLRNTETVISECRTATSAEITRTDSTIKHVPQVLSQENVTRQQPHAPQQQEETLSAPQEQR